MHLITFKKTIDTEVFLQFKEKVCIIEEKQTFLFSENSPKAVIIKIIKNKTIWFDKDINFLLSFFYFFRPLVHHFFKNILDFILERVWDFAGCRTMNSRAKKQNEW